MQRLLLLFMLVAATAQAQQDELLWKADNTASPTTVPVYGGWPTPFMQRARTTDDTLTDEQRAAAAREAAQRAAAEEAAAAQARQRAEAAARQKADRLAANSNAIEANLNGVKLDGVVQGPLGSSIFWNGKWLTKGTQIMVPTQVGAQMGGTLSQLDAADNLAAGMLRENLQRRLSSQSSISVTLVGITSTTAVFSDGRRTYTLTLRQPPI